jgi:glyoxylate/hydroxypyruvate reductase A
VTNIQRKCDEYFRAQMDSRWDKSIEEYKNIDNHEVSIGVMGLGVMGGQVAKTLSLLGYPVRGWTRRERSKQDLDPAFENVQLYHGSDQLFKFAASSSIVINLLPLTESTKGILNSSLFDAMPAGGAIFNLARGAHLVADDLLEALKTGQLDAAVLDVFVKEPLPPTCPFWKHEKIRVFPHMSSVTDISNGVDQIVRNRSLILQNKELPPGVLADVVSGY